MSPQSPRYPNPVSGDDAETGGRHRRPESLADVVVPRSVPAVAAFSVGRFDDSFIERGFTDAGTRASRRSASRAAAPRRRRARPARHSAALRSGAPQAAAKPPVTGIHRAPGTLPLETLLRVGKGRQQVLLASLIAVGLLVVAVPAQQRRETANAVNAAAQLVIGGQPARTPARNSAAKPSGTKGKTASGHSKTDPTPTASATAAAPAVAARKPAAKNAIAPAPGHGPGHSLRTTGTAAVALTFDDGPDPVQTPRILALLAQYQIKATFCLVGKQAQKHPDVVRQIVAAGHTLCNHTWDHSLTIGKDDPAKIQQDLARTNAAIRAAVPGARIPFFRAPGGNFTDQLVAVAANDQMASLYWEVDPRDWDHPTGEDATKHIDKVVAEVREHVRPGSIVLSHDFNQPDTIAAYAKLLPWLKQNFQIGLPGAPVPATTSPEPAPTTTAPTSPAPTPSTPTPSTPVTSAPAVAPSPSSSAAAAAAAAVTP
jgi:peptidoglycan-N-acetylglucosamine deacetylase